MMPTVLSEPFKTLKTSQNVAKGPGLGIDLDV